MVMVSGVVAWIPIAGSRGLQILLTAIRVGGGILIPVLLLLLPAVLPALAEMHPRRSARNAAAIWHWRKTLRGCQGYMVSYLAMYPQTR